ncbi:MAG: 30S ribosomal protein S12 methylthiotransferase RimO [Clostridia bacterium]|nr:30S ribosomal protein S12 methylthiotransferase RimO [Clostridia bacterium]
MLMNVGFISLGCTKNLIDTEMAIGLFKNNNYKIVNNVEEAEAIVINTCGFIESAKEEAINTILEMAEYKEKGSCKYLVVMGCLVQRYKKELQKALPEVDLFLSIDEYQNFWEKVETLIENKEEKSEDKMEYLDRVITTGKTTTYLKIAEGCSNRCTYCAIPNIRGPYISRPFEEIIEEAKQLAKDGYKEIIVIAQDTTKYGIDLYGKSRFAELLAELAKIIEFKWIRFLYAYPETITDELIEIVKKNENICKYFDIPIQHISDKVLKRMNRKTTGKDIENLIEKIKKEIPDAILRTSLIVGFPGETEEDFKALENFVSKAKFDKLGVFTYSKEEGTPAARLPEQIHYKTKQKRYNKIMEIAKKTSKENLQKTLGKTYEVLIEAKTFDNKYYIGRTYMDIPNEDGVVFVKNTKQIPKGTWAKCEITDIKDYDLIGEII